MAAFERWMAQDGKQGGELVELQAALLLGGGVAQVFFKMRHYGPRRDLVETRLARVTGCAGSATE
jgi:hypothetical protein